MNISRPVRASGLVVAVALFGSVALAQVPAPVQIQVPVASDAYTVTPDSLVSKGVPQGQVFQFEMADSKIFPETTRTISVYVPAEYKPGTSACVYVGLDGLGFRAATVFDNLIATHEMPVTVAIGISPGTVNSADGSENPRFDRSFEFDTRSDRLARFILDEVFPAVEGHTTSDGRKIMLSKDPNDHAIGGASTGGIGAFTVAWERPDQFHRVFSAIGTFVGMRGGEQYYVSVRKTAPKPIRIFMQDGVHDEWGGGPEMGDWWMSNQTMQRALAFAGYDVKHVWGAGTHNTNQADAIFPEAMRWLWRGWPASIEPGKPGNPALQGILKPEAQWEIVAENCVPGTYIASDPTGHLFYGDGTRAVQLGTATASSQCHKQSRAAVDPIAFDASGMLYRADGSRQDVMVGPVDSTKPRVVTHGLHVDGMTVRQNGDLYVTAQNNDGEIWMIHRNGSRVLLKTGLKGPSGVALSPDGLWLFVSQQSSRFGYSYRVKPNGMLDAGEPFYDFQIPGWADDSGAGSIWMDTNGLAYVATRAGVQIFDRNGRVVGILSLPNNGEATSLAFGGEGFHTPYVSSGGKIYARDLRITGAPAWRSALKLAPGGAG